MRSDAFDLLDKKEGLWFSNGDRMLYRFQRGLFICRKMGLYYPIIQV